MIRMLIQGTTCSPFNIANIHTLVQPLRLGACLTPVLAMSIPIYLLIPGYVIMQSVTVFLHGATLFGTTYGLPTLAATILLNRMAQGMSRAERGIWSALCILATIGFMLHPHVGYGAGFALYWLIPALLIAKGPSTSMTQALSASFIAHMVGSWCYLMTVPSNPALWATLIPIVAMERLQYALVLTGALSVRSIIQARIRGTIPAHNNFPRITTTI